MDRYLLEYNEDNYLDFKIIDLNENPYFEFEENTGTLVEANSIKELWVDAVETICGLISGEANSIKSSRKYRCNSHVIDKIKRLEEFKLVAIKKLQSVSSKNDKCLNSNWGK